MGISKTEINLRRLLGAAPQQQNQAKLIHVSHDINEFKLFICQTIYVNASDFGFSVCCHSTRTIRTAG